MKKYNINTSTFDKLDEKSSIDDLLNSLKKPLEKVREELEHQAIIHMIEDITWLKRNLIITQICFGLAIIVLAISSMLK